MNESWIKIYRKFLEWEWYDDINTKVLFLHLLLKANIEEKDWHGTPVKRGEYVTSLDHLSKETGLSVRSIRTSIDKLKSTGELTDRTTSKFRVITICKFDDYQDSEIQSDNQTTSKRQSKRQANDKQSDKQATNLNVAISNSCSVRQSQSDKQSDKQATSKTTTTKEYIIDNDSLRSSSSSNIKKREAQFYNELIPFVEVYGKEMIRAFFNYWSEPNKSKTKMRFELEKTWDTKRRLTTWANRNKSNNNGTNLNTTQQRSTERQERRNEVVDIIQRLRAEDQSL